MFGYPQQMRGNGGAAGPLPFIFSVTVGSGQSFQLPLISGGTYDALVDWGDTTSSSVKFGNDPNRIHTYTTGGTYDIRISGVLNGWSVNQYGDRLKITEIKQWGILKLGSGVAAFYNAANMVITATDILDTSECTDFLAAFRGCTSLTDIPNIGLWDTSNVTNMASCFYGCTQLNPDVGNWDVSSVVTFATGVNGMFQGCPVFNRDLNSWNVSSATSMMNMFRGCTIFNGNISSWNVSNVLYFYYMFDSCPAFNGDISGWNTVSATRMDFMFFNCTSFNADLSGWDVSSVTNMGWMFRNTAFDRDIGAWDMTSVTTAQNMFLLSTLSTANYDALLIGWAAQTLQSAVAFHAGGSKYTAGGAAEAARNVLINTYGWTITDGGIA